MDNPAGFFAWIWAALIIALVVSCTARANEADTLQAVKNSVDGRIFYEEYYAKDYRYISKQSWGKGNCATFAATYAIDAKAAGVDGHVLVCEWGDTGKGHAVFVSQSGKVLDQRKPFVTTLAELKAEGCH